MPGVKSGNVNGQQMSSLTDKYCSKTFADLGICVFPTRSEQKDHQQKYPFLALNSHVVLIQPRNLSFVAQAVRTLSV